MVQKIFFSTTPNIFPKIILANSVYINAPNCHFTRTPNEYIIYFILDGKMILKENTNIYNLKKGDCLLLDSSRTHSGIRSNSSVKYLYIHFQTDFIENIFLQNDFTRLSIKNKIYLNETTNNTILIPKYSTLKPPYYKQFLNNSNELIHIMNNITEHKNILAGCSLLKLFILLEKAFQYSLISDTPPKDIRVLELINYLNEHYAEDITSSKIANYFYNNYDYLNRIFKKQTGKTIFCYLNEYRITESKKLLYSGLLTNKEIAEKVGFHNEFYYSKVFKQYTGLSPREYKTNGGIKCNKVTQPFST